MRDALLNDLINTLERHGCEIKISIPTTRGRAERSKTDSDLARHIATLRDDYGMTLAKIAEHLTGKLGCSISVASIHTWTGGAVPRKVGYDKVLNALNEIMSEHVAIEGGAWVDSKEIKATVERWMEVMTPRQIAVAADEAVTSVRSWATGNHRVLRTKWRRVVPQVEQMCEIIQAQHIET
ncbi:MULTISPECIES: hypothetical protein [Halomonadaceae]|jgi:hypothetical protein|uniref:Uncharacterized protein n=4 Tax=Vreelandella TaxID=3137766 RepID=A0A3S0W9I5_9GAMM|nr:MULTISPECIES: hypothetical protein [Halomonas]MCH4813897.1 hypothetical protein [Halomonas neptunia]NVF15410.1 hypothetical protein [Halomonas maris]NYS79187.1 hypothetical protein [Halomonas glaciei]RUR32126.1 hypothetical protein ELY38_08420 [Halomonas nanhaiensis]|tara:strand:- start:5560 stop:6102 length:543 start_codon:yes stop_codon:yes gene_type:complete